MGAKYCVAEMLLSVCRAREEIRISRKNPIARKLRQVRSRERRTRATSLNSGTTDQALDLHDFAGFLSALRAGSGYANMHTTRFSGGEIRGQIRVGGGDAGKLETRRQKVEIGKILGSAVQRRPSFLATEEKSSRAGSGAVRLWLDWERELHAEGVGEPDEP
ncbi:MAG: hypothetical protein DMG45_23620 [Acidobacteria bacterium]|nr:MAG: hypothetical protein DMG45_23620 [Acidobacteriota bacterium]